MELASDCWILLSLHRSIFLLPLHGSYRGQLAPRVDSDPAGSVKVPDLLLPDSALDACSGFCAWRSPTIADCLLSSSF